MKNEIKKIKIYKTKDSDKKYAIVIYDNNEAEFVEDRKLLEKRIESLYNAKNDDTHKKKNEIFEHLQDKGLLRCITGDIIKSVDYIQASDGKYKITRISGTEASVSAEDLEKELMRTYENKSLMQNVPNQQSKKPDDKIKIYKTLMHIVAAGLAVTLIPVAANHIVKNKSNSNDDKGTKVRIETTADPDFSKDSYPELEPEILDSEEEFRERPNLSGKVIVEEVINGNVINHYEDEYNFEREDLIQLNRDSFDSVRNYFYNSNENPMEQGKASYIDFSYGFDGDDKLYLQNFSEMRNELERSRYQIAENQNDAKKREKAIEKFKVLLNDANQNNIIRIITNDDGVNVYENGTKRCIYFDDLSEEAKDLIIDLAVDMTSPLLDNEVEYNYNYLSATYSREEILDLLEAKYDKYHGNYSK